MSGPPPITSSHHGLLADYQLNPATQVWLADWKTHKLPYCTVYIIAPEAHWPCKIGVSTYGRKRLASLQTSHWKRLYVTHSFWCGTIKEATAVEAKAHQMLDEEEVWLLGEWFDKRPDKAAEVVRFSAEVLGIELNDRVEESEPLEEVRAWWEREASAYRSAEFQSHYGSRAYSEEHPEVEALLRERGKRGKFA